MSVAIMMRRIAKASPRFKARMAGALNLFSLLTAAFTELFVLGRLNFAGGLIAIAGMVVVTLLVYDLLKPVNRSLFARGVLQPLSDALYLAASTRNDF